MPIKRKEEEKLDQDESTTTPKTSKRLRNSIIKVKQEEPPNQTQQKQQQQSQSPETLTIVSNERQTRHKSIQNKGNQQQAQQSQTIEKNQYFEDYFDIICSYQDDTQRYLANIFYVLPSRKEYPDYYDIIKNPIDLKQIARNVLNSKYKTIRQMEIDLTLMLDNAKRYNDPKSYLYKDACKLKKLVKDKSKELNSLMESKKLYQSSKTREKKLKLLQEIADTGSDNEQEQLNEEKEDEDDTEEQNDNEEEDDEDETDDGEDSDEEHDTSKSKKSINLNSTDEIEEPNKTSTTTTTAATSSRRTKQNSKLISTMWSIFDYIKEYKHLNQKLIDPFLKLPSKRLYPDYYEEIKQPIAMNLIKKKLNKRLYKTFKDLLNDLELIFKNAMQYNLEESVIYLNAKRLQDALKIKSNELLTNIPDIMSQTQSSPSAPSTPNRKAAKLLNSNQSIKTTPIKSLQTNNNLTTTALPKFTDLKEKMIYLYNYINDYQIEQRELAPPFRHLPSRTEYPDYYNVIKKPIDMTKIWNRINHIQNSYTSLDDMCSDFSLMFENACIFNEPTSMLYKDALNLQRALFTRRDEILNYEISLQDKLNPDLNELEQLPDKYVENQVQDLIENLFDSCMQYQDLEGRVLSETFLDLYALFDLDPNSIDEPIKTFDLIQQRIKNYVYKRLDMFQEEMFDVFNQIRIRSYSSLDEKLNNKFKIHRYSQLFRDAYELQRYFIQKRDELCRNGEYFLSGALSFKLSSLDSYISSIIGTSASHFDESEALLVDSKFKQLENKLNQGEVATSSFNNKLQLINGNFYYINRDLVKKSLNLNVISNTNEPVVCCLLTQNQSKSKIIVQLYLRVETDKEFFLDEKNFLKTKKHFHLEIFKTDIYALIELNDDTIDLKPCLVIGLKDYMLNDANFQTQQQQQQQQNTSDSNSIQVELNKNDIYVCESIYSSEFNYFRKLTNKKWSPLQFINSNTQQLQQQQQNINFNFQFVKRQTPILIERNYLDENFVKLLKSNVDSKLNEIQVKTPLFKHFYRETIQYDSPPAAFLHKDTDEIEANSQQIEQEDQELMKTATYYEQLNYKQNNVLYKLGDYVYIKYQQLNPNQVNDPRQQPLIVRIDRLWSIKNDFYLRGPVFLRSTDIPHEPTRLFYRNEVFKEITRELTVNLDQIILNKKCVVMNPKKYCSSRLTDILEQDVYVCETKYSLQNKTFRKFTKGLRKFELSVKCSEDEVYFMRKELQLRKHLSPLLIDLNINYEDDSSDYLKNFNDPNMNDDDDWNEQMKDDENSSQSFTEHMDTSVNVKNFSIQNENSNSHSTSGVSTIKKIRIKRAKKSGFNLFSKDFRKSLRDTQSSLSFTDMSKEVGLRWRALSDKERAAYEERAVIETAREAERRAIEENNLKQQSMIASPLPIQQQTITNSTQLISVTQTPINQAQMLNKPNTPILVYQQQQQQQQQAQQIGMQQQQAVNYEQVKKVETPKQVLHKEAYVRYIANLKKQQLFNQSNAIYNPNANMAYIHHSDWYNSIDIRPARVKENKIQQPPAAWIENCSSGDLLQNLLSLRYYLLTDAITIEKENLNDYQVESIEQTDEQSNELSDEQSTLTVL